jgi:putative DNA primase/helicase
MKAPRTTTEDLPEGFSLDDLKSEPLGSQKNGGPPPKPTAGEERYSDTICSQLLAQGDAGRLARHADEDSIAHWLHWDGRRLLREPGHCMYTHVQGIAHKLFEEADALREKWKQLKKRLDAEYLKEEGDIHMVSKLKREMKKAAARGMMLERSAGHLESAEGMGGVIKVATGEQAFRVKTAQLDQHPLWLNVQNGVLDLETGKLIPQRIEHLITKVANTHYNPKATCPRWMAFLEQIIPDKEVRAFLQRSIGYSLCDDVSERCFWIYYGTGCNGKSTFISTIRRLLGDYAETAAASVLMVKPHGDDKRNDVAVLRGARFVACSESDEGQRVAEALIKQLAGGEDRLKVRLMYAEFFEFAPTFKIHLATNHRPQITGTDAAIWDRVRLVPFDVRIPEEDIDRGLSAALAQELPGILNWALEGYRAWRLGGLQTPKIVRAATEEYRQEMDVLGNWIGESCDVDVNLQAGATDLYESYKSWAMNHGHYVMSAKSLSMKLAERGFKKHKDGDGYIFFLGLAVKEVHGRRRQL